MGLIRPRFSDSVNLSTDFTKSISAPFLHASLLTGPVTGFHTAVFATFDTVRSSQNFSVT